MFFCLSNSADYVTGFEGHGTVEILDSKGKSIFKESYEPFEVISAPMGRKLDFVPDETLTYAVLKMNLYDDDDNLMDETSIVYDYSRFQNIPSEFSLELNRKEFVQGDTLSYSVTYVDDFGKPLSGEVLIYLINPDGNIVHAISDKRISGSLDGSVKLVGKAGEYNLVVREVTHNIKTEKAFVLDEPVEESNYWWLIGLILFVLVMLVMVVLKVKKK